MGFFFLFASPVVGEMRQTNASAVDDDVNTEY
jgi:hypothetical protein